MDSVRLDVPASIANCGVGFSIFSIGLEKPSLRVTVTKNNQKRITTSITSAYEPPKGRILGYTGIQTAKHLIKKYNLPQGYAIDFYDTDFPVGGIGRSSSEAVGVLLGIAHLNELKLSREEVIDLTSDVEPGKGMGNVAGSTNGGFSLVYLDEYKKVNFVLIKIPKKLGIVVGISSFPKIRGTAGGQAVLKSIPPLDFPLQSGLVGAAIIALERSDVDSFIKVSWGDIFIEPIRADCGIYGEFTKKQYLNLKKKLFEKYNIAMIASGGGPSMAFYYNKDNYPNGIIDILEKDVRTWFKNKKIELNTFEAKAAKEGAYDQVYNT